MAPHLGSSNRAKRVQFILLLFSIFIVYCVYSIAINFPSSKDLVHTASTKDVPPLLPPLQTCIPSNVLRNVDPNHTNAHLEFWQHLSNQTVATYKKRWQKFMASVKQTSIPKWENERGIVLVAGNKDTFTRTLTAIEVLRNVHGCKLDIEVWHLSDEQPSEAVKEKLEMLRAKSRDLSDPQLVRPIQFRRDAEKQFQIKAAAVINSSFKEVLYLDSDNFPAQDPTFLFDTAEYQRTGALFWPDFWKTHVENKIFDIMGIHCEDEWEQESGQMVINKEKSWLPLQLAWYMQKHYELYFQLLNGDKDTFKYAWKALGVPYHMTEAMVGMAGTMVGDRFCGHTMLQYSPSEEVDDDQIVFVHANLLKITDKMHFMTTTEEEEGEHPWDLAKRSSFSHRNTWIKPEFYIAPGGRACMDFTHRQGEPEAVTENFDLVLPGLQQKYFEYGGIGGETRA